MWSSVYFQRLTLTFWRMSGDWARLEAGKASGGFCKRRCLSGRRRSQRKQRHSTKGPCQWTGGGCEGRGSLNATGLIPGSGRFPWRRKWQPTPVVLPGESHGQRNLVGCTQWSPKRVGHNLATKQQQNNNCICSQFQNWLAPLMCMDPLLLPWRDPSFTPKRAGSMQV